MLLNCWLSFLWPQSCVQTLAGLRSQESQSQVWTWYKPTPETISSLLFGCVGVHSSYLLPMPLLVLLPLPFGLQQAMMKESLPSRCNDYRRYFYWCCLPSANANITLWSSQRWGCRCEMQHRCSTTLLFVLVYQLTIDSTDRRSCIFSWINVYLWLWLRMTLLKPHLG